MKIRFLHIDAIRYVALLFSKKKFSVIKHNVYFRGTNVCVLAIDYALISSVVPLLGAI